MTPKMPTLSAEQVAARLGVGLSTVYRWERADKMPRAIRETGKPLRWYEAEIEGFVVRSDPLRAIRELEDMDFGTAKSLKADAQRLLYEIEDLAAKHGELGRLIAMVAKMTALRASAIEFRVIGYERRKQMLEDFEAGEDPAKTEGGA